MRAIVYRGFGGPDVVAEATLPDPAPGKGEVLVRLTASSVNTIDIRIREGRMWPLADRRFPKVPGADVVGTVMALGAGVTGFTVGQAVFGATNVFKGGAFAELVAVPAGQVAALPAGLSPEAAACLPTAGLAGVIAIHDLGQVRAGQRVLIHGASGAAGLFAVQVAARAGAVVTAVATGAGLAQALALGAHRGIDYRAGPPEWPDAFDIIVNFSGALPFARARALLAPAGRFIEPSPTIPTFMGSMIANRFRAQQHLMLQTVANTDALAALAARVVAGKIAVTIDRTLPLADAAAAHTAQAKGGVVGKIVVLA